MCSTTTSCRAIRWARPEDRGLSEHHGDGVTRREVLIGVAAWPCVAAIDAPGALAQDGPASRTSAAIAGQLLANDRPRRRHRVRGPATAGREQSDPGLAGAPSQRPRHRRHRWNRTDTLPSPEEANDLLIKPAASRRSRALTESARFSADHQPEVRSAELTYLRGPAADQPAAFLHPVRRQDEPMASRCAVTTAARNRAKSTSDPRGPDPGSGRRRREVRRYRRRHHVRRSLALSALERDHGYDRLPWWNIGGNHDLNFEAPDRKYSRETFKRVYGRTITRFYAQTLFLMLDDVNYLGSTRTNLEEGASTRAGSIRGNSSSCATCSRIRRTTR